MSAEKKIHYLFPFARLCVLHNIVQFCISVAPPLLQAVTWSASISVNLYIRALLLSLPRAHNGQFDIRQVPNVGVNSVFGICLS